MKKQRTKIMVTTNLTEKQLKSKAAIRVLVGFWLATAIINQAKQI